MQTVNVHEAKTHLSKLLARVAAGERIVISRAGKPVAVLEQYFEPSAQRPIGVDKGRVTVRENWDDPLPEFDEYS
jgi:antitoxin (DNA-binding transcriptional repressor) of toxin-antitoxin stability system